MLSCRLQRALNEAKCYLYGVNYLTWHQMYYLAEAEVHRIVQIRPQLDSQVGYPSIPTQNICHSTLLTTS